MFKNFFYKLLLAGTDSKPELTVGYNFDTDSFIKAFCIILLLIVIFGGIIVFAYISHLKTKIRELEEKNKTEDNNQTEEEHE